MARPMFAQLTKQKQSNAHFSATGGESWIPSWPDSSDMHAVDTRRRGRG
jgi:hypothetical protein